MDSILADMRSFIAGRVREGFDSFEEIVEGAMEYALDEYDEENLEPEILRLTTEALETHQKEQSNWKLPTDCDRLEEAFAALNRQGIVARQQFSCCNNCGHTEIWDEIEEAEEEQPVEGYVFYHFQSTERAIEAGTLYLTYGCVAEDEAALIRVAQKIVAELQQAGLKVSWQGDGGYAIIVEDMVWRKRR